MKHEALYVCEYCDSDQNCHPASDLHIWYEKDGDGGELICNECFCNKSPDEKEKGQPKPFVPELERENAAIWKANEDLKNDYHKKEEAFRSSVVKDGLIIVALERENAELKKLVEQMKCCENCGTLPAQVRETCDECVRNLARPEFMRGSKDFWVLDQKFVSIMQPIWQAALEAAKGGK